MFGGPVEIQAGVPGAGDGGQTIVFNPGLQNQRSALLLANGNVYIAWGSYGDKGIYHGWVMAYSASTLQQTAVWNDTPDGTAGGIWSPGDVMADGKGNIFVSTGNGDTSAKSGGTGYSLALVKLNGSDLSVADFFMPPNVNDLNSPDLDLAGGGFVLVPDGLLPDEVRHVRCTTPRS